MKKSNKIIVYTTMFVATLAFSLSGPMRAYAATSPTLTGALTYSALGATDLTNTGSTTTTGDVGVSSGTSVTGFPPGIAGGNNATHVHSNDASAIAAQANNLATFGALDQTCDQSFGSVNLVTTFPSGVSPGVYCSTGSFSITGHLTLVGSGVWIFKTVSTLIAASGSSVTGGDPCNVWWRVASSATLGTTASLIGNILALTSISLDTGATLNGRALAQTGGVTLDANTITGPICTTPGLPNTGTKTNDNQSILLNLSTLFGITILASISLIIRRRYDV